jgi:UPF0755 protein
MKRIVLALAVVGSVAAGAAWWMRAQLTTPYQGFEGADVFVDVPSGTSVAGIAERLVAAGVVHDTLTFRLAARFSGTDRRLQAGEYRFAGASTPFDVLRRLQSGDVFTRSVTFPEGLTVREMSQIVGKSGLATPEEFLAAAASPEPVRDLDPEARSLEGYLFPDTYALARRAGADGVVHAAVQRFTRAFDADLRAEAAARGMTVREVVTLASLIEKETAAADERPLVSAVYHNRLRKRMPLQCDPTVIYALMLAGTWNGNLRRVDLQVNSPYNTYRFPGLPPGPIAAPGRLSLEAAVRPASVPYLYFVSRNDGTHVFASTLAEHNRNVAIWQVRYFKRR